jgi:D-sedoheptulose 7-phosphate isomerase
MPLTFKAVTEQHLEVVQQLLQENTGTIEAAAVLLQACLRQGGKILLCGNGGSAADCQHLAAEFVVRYEQKRQALAAIALTTDTSILTAHTNDYDFASVFARQIEALGMLQDCLIAISTSGCSANIVAAAQAARQKGMKVISLTGAGGGDLAQYADVAVKIPSTVTARIQEAHILVGHWWCNAVEEALGAGNHT